jgi:phosphoribosylanthranilate isomerase
LRLKAPENIKAVAALSPDLYGLYLLQPLAALYWRIGRGYFGPAARSYPQNGRFCKCIHAEPSTKLINKYGFEAIQLHGDESPGYCAAFKAQQSSVIKAFGVDERF